MFMVPTFNLSCRIYTSAPPPSGALRLTSQCQLRSPLRINTSQILYADDGAFIWALCLPARTDIRDWTNSTGEDFVEVPVGSGRIYRVGYSDDVARGFTNEYRIAFIRKWWPWPTPTP